jgi:hypothetical protein
MATKKTTPEVEAEIKAETPVVATDETATEKPEVTETVTDEPKEEKKAAKAGKRSEKSLKRRAQSCRRHHSSGWRNQSCTKAKSNPQPS